ncbi:MAG: hypothetical protein PHG66_04375 [Candidatus Colwellbacteria bacterium]|nr:hypothetical protein [Candidatus Colwellbacteria bacterium]
MSTFIPKTDKISTRCVTHQIPSDAFNTYDENGDMDGEYHWTDRDLSDEEMTVIVLKYAEPDIKRGDLVYIDDGGDRESDAFVWDGTKAVHFSGSELMDYPAYPIVAGISIDEFSTVDYYKDKDFYNSFVWLNIEGYEFTRINTQKGILMNKTKGKRYEIGIIPDEDREPSSIENGLNTLKESYPTLLPFGVGYCISGGCSTLYIKDV